MRGNGTCFVLLSSNDCYESAVRLPSLLSLTEFFLHVSLICLAKAGPTKILRQVFIMMLCWQFDICRVFMLAFVVQV